MLHQPAQFHQAIVYVKEKVKVKVQLPEYFGVWM